MPLNFSLLYGQKCSISLKIEMLLQKFYHPIVVQALDFRQVVLPFFGPSWPYMGHKKGYLLLHVPDSIY